MKLQGALARSGRRAVPACSHSASVQDARPLLQAFLVSRLAPGQRNRQLKREEIGMDRHRALACCLSMIFSENRFTLFRIML
jgi:hypothetical protein